MEHLLVVVLAFTVAGNDPDWPAFKKNMEARYEQYQTDTGGSGNWDSWLGDNFITLRKPKNQKELKKVVFFIAMFKEKGAQCPKELLEYDAEFGKALQDVIPNFTWDRLEAKLIELDTLSAVQAHFARP